MTKNRPWNLLLIMALLPIGCDDSTQSKAVDADDGVSGGDAGQADTAFADGGSDTSSGPPDGQFGAGCFPECVQELFAACWPEGPTCSLSFRAQARLECFANGVKVDATFGAGAIVTKPDGNSLCYSISVPDPGAESGPTELRYYKERFSHTSLVATLRFASPGAKAGTIQCEPKRGMQQPEPVPIDLASPACALSKNGIGGEFVVPCVKDGMCQVPMFSKVTRNPNEIHLRGHRNLDSKEARYSDGL